MHRCYSKLAAVLTVTLSIPLLAGDLSQTFQKRAVPPNDSLRNFLRTYLKGRSAQEDRTTYLSAASVRLSGNRGSEVIAYVTGQGWCGSGGCLTLILAPRDQSFRVVSSITVSRPPIRVLRSVSNGWHDIGVWVQGGGIQPGYEAILRFDGKSYPSNPTIPPASRSEGSAGEIVLQTGQEGTPLYP